MNIWKIATINVKGLNKNEKFEDVMNWIIINNFDATILTETKLKPILAIFNSLKYKKNYTFHWTIDPEHTKGTGVAIIAKKSTIGKHTYRHHTVKGRCITIYNKFKGRKTITITGIYGPAAHDQEAKDTKNTILNHIQSLPAGSPNTHHIFAGDFNEAPKAHMQTPMLDKLDTHDSINLTEFLDPSEYTWSNHRDTHRTLDHIIVPSEMTIRQVKIKTNTVCEHFETDHRAVIAILDLNHILLENSGAKRRQRHKSGSPIINHGKNKDAQWEKYNAKIEQTFISPFQENWNADYTRAYNNIVNQLLDCANETLFWKNTDNGDFSTFTKTETLIFKGRRAITNLLRNANTHTNSQRETEINKLERLFPDETWTPNSTTHTNEVLRHIKRTWAAKKRKLYLLKERETHRHIVEAVKTRTDNFKKDKGKMLRSF